MTKDCGIRLRIHQCRDCNKILKGTDWSKHVTETGHKKSWRRLFCSAHEQFKDAHFKNSTFLLKHSGCAKQKNLSNSNFRQYIADTRRVKGERHNLSPPEDSDLCSDNESDAGCNTEGEIEDSLTSITDSEEDEMLKDENVVDRERERFKDKIAQNCDVEERHESENKEEGEKEKENRKPKNDDGKQKEGEEQSKEDGNEEEMMNVGKNNEKKAGPTQRLKKKVGIVKQGQKWRKDLQLEAISRRNYLEGVYQKYIALESRHKQLLEEHTKIQVQGDNAKACREELELQRGSLRAKNLELVNYQTKLDREQARLRMASDEIRRLEAVNKELMERNESERAEKEQMKREREAEKIQKIKEDFQQIELHIPCRNSEIVGEILAYDLETEDVEECYENQSADLNCLHLRFTRIGKEIKVRRRKVIKGKKLPFGNEPSAKRPRIE